MVPMKSVNELIQETIAEFERLVPDKGMRDYITNDIRNPFNNLNNFGRLYNNVVNLAFTYAFSCFHDLANRNYAENGTGILDQCRNSGNANSLRVLNTMEKVYREYPLTNELIQFVLLDVYFDFYLGGKSRLKSYFPNCMSVGETQINDYFPIINQSIGVSRIDIFRQMGKDKIFGMFIDLLKMFPFLSTTKLEFDKERRWYVFRIPSCKSFPKGIVNTFGIVARAGEGTPSYYCLTDVQDGVLKYEKIGTKSYILCNLDAKDDNGYSEGVICPPFDLPIDGEYVCSYLVPAKLESRIDYQPAYAIDQLFNINYKYIKNLALAIADALGSGYAECGRALIREFVGLYPHICEKFDKNSKNWDSVVLMLLIEASPSQVLQKLFYSKGDINDELAAQIVDNLRKRFGNLYAEELTELSEYGVLLEKAEQAVRVRQLTLNASPIKTRTYEHLYRSLVAEAMANLVLSAIADNEKPEFADTFYIGNTGQNLEALENLKSISNAQQKCDGVRWILGDLIRKIICFYEGIFAYGRKKLEYDRKSEFSMLSDDEVHDYQEIAEKAFVNAAESTYHRLSQKADDSLLSVMRDFLALTERCFKTYGNTMEGQENSVYLHAVLGKDAILDANDFRNHLDIDRMEDLKESNVDWWIDKAIDVIHFLRDGKFRAHGADHDIYAAITPLVASYNKGNVTRDGYHTAMFTMIIDSAGTEDVKTWEINVLSEFQYNMSSKYYCLPNIGRSTEKWWIDPFIIKCQLFDDIFETR